MVADSVVVVAAVGVYSAWLAGVVVVVLTAAVAISAARFCLDRPRKSLSSRDGFTCCDRPVAPPSIVDSTAPRFTIAAAFYDAKGARNGKRRRQRVQATVPLARVGLEWELVDCPPL